MSDQIRYATEDNLDPEAFIDVLRRSGLDARRPVGDHDRIRRMVENADLIVTARDGAGKLVGVARSVTDFSYCCYLSDLAVDRAWQHRGIGRELIRRTHDAAGAAECTLILISAPAALAYYPKIGMSHADNAFIIRAAEKLPD